MPTAEKVLTPAQTLGFGPWLGSMRSATPDQVPPEFIASVDSSTPSSNFLFLPRTGTWRRRNGATEKFDTYASEVGLLPAKWTNDPVSGSGHSRIRHMEEFLSDAVTDGNPTVCALLNRMTVPTGYLDDGRFSNFWWRDQVASTNRTLCDDFSATTYPASGTQYFRVTPLWYESGDGGLSRGISEFARRFLVPGSRRFLKTGNQWYFPDRYGTPARWSGTRASVATAALTASSDLSYVSGQVGVGKAVDETATIYSGGNTAFPDLATSGDGHWLRIQNDLNSRTVTLGLSGTVSDNTTYTITFSAKNDLGTPAGTTQIILALVTSAQKRYTATTILPASAWTTTFALYTATVVCDGSAGTNGALTANSIEFGESASSATSTYSAFDYVRVTSGSTAGTYDYIFPTGPFPPTHAGSAAHGNVTSSSTTEYVFPNADRTDGGFLNEAGSATNLFASIDDTTVNDADYIYADFNGATCQVDLATPSVVPTASSHRVEIHVRLAKLGLFSDVSIVTDLYAGAVGAASSIIPITNNTATTGVITIGFVDYSYTLTAAEIAATTVASPDWSNIQLQFDPIRTNGRAYISQAYLKLVPLGVALEGGWKGHDRYMMACAYRFEDNSIWAMNIPRFPNSNLSSGFNMVTVDAANPDQAYDSVLYSNLPVGPKGTKEVLLFRTDKIDFTSTDNLQLNPTAFKFINSVPNGTTTYRDFAGDDASLTVDTEGLFIRYDHMMAPRARYNYAGDMRVCHSFGGNNPIAIELALVGATADYDRNLLDTSTTLWTATSASWQAGYMRLDLSTSGVMTLTLLLDTGAATSTVTFGSGTYTSIQDLVDAINATSITTTPNCGQWRAQIAPGANEAAAMTDLTPHSRAIASVSATSGSPIISATSGMSKVAVGAYVTHANVTAGTYVTAIIDDTQLQMSANATGTASATGTFYFRIGDDPTSLSNVGYQRVIANCLPGFLYYNATYLGNQTFDKAGTWMTVATPGSMKSAPNSWSESDANRFTPPRTAGICQGGAAVDHGFVVLYANMVGAISPRDQNHLEDGDYGLVMIDENHGCCAWNTVTPGNRFVPFMSAEGIFAADLENVRLLSEQIYVDSPVPLGDFTYEGPHSVAAAAADTDDSYAWARVIRGVLWVGFRSSSSTTHCDRIVQMDFTTGEHVNGLLSLYRKPGLVWGWSVPLQGTAASGWAYNLVGLGRRNDAGNEGFHTYGWHDTQGSTGDGRMDELDSTATDNGVAIAGRVETPWLRPPSSELISGQEAVLEHSSPAGSTGSLIVTRTLTGDPYTLTPGTSSLTTFSEMKFFPQGARAAANAFRMSYVQATGTAREIRRMVLRFRRVERFRT